MTQQLHYTIDTFELNYEATPLTGVQRRFMNMHRGHLLAGNKKVEAADVIYDTICFELPTYFTQSTNEEKCIEIQYIHLMQRPNGIETTGSSTTVVKNITPSIGPTGTPILTVTTTTTSSDGSSSTTTEVSNNEEWVALASTMHSDLVQFRPSADSYVMSTNVMYNWEKKFHIPTNKSTFDIWFRNLTGKLIDLDPAKTRIIIELLLTF